MSRRRAAPEPKEPRMSTTTAPRTTPHVVIVHRTEAEAAKAGNIYTARAECTTGNCRYKSRWSQPWKAEEAAALHTCER